MTNVHKLVTKQDTDVPYLGQTIHLEYRPKTNDWEYIITITLKKVIKGHNNTYEKCLKDAKKQLLSVKGK